MWDVSKAKLRGKCVALNTFLRKQEYLKINNYSYPEDRKEQIKSKLPNKIIVKKEQKQKTTTKKRGSIKAKVL